MLSISHQILPKPQNKNCAQSMETHWPNPPHLQLRLSMAYKTADTMIQRLLIPTILLTSVTISPVYQMRVMAGTQALLRLLLPRHDTESKTWDSESRAATLAHWLPTCLGPVLQIASLLVQLIAHPPSRCRSLTVP